MLVGDLVDQLGPAGADDVAGAVWRIGVRWEPFLEPGRGSKPLRDPRGRSPGARAARRDRPCPRELAIAQVGHREGAQPLQRGRVVEERQAEHRSPPPELEPAARGSQALDCVLRLGARLALPRKEHRAVHWRARRGWRDRRRAPPQRGRTRAPDSDHASVSVPSVRPRAISGTAIAAPGSELRHQLEVPRVIASSRPATRRSNSGKTTGSPDRAPGRPVAASPSSADRASASRAEGPPFSRVDRGDRHLADRDAVVLEHVDDAPVREGRNRELRDPNQGGFPVERGSECLARVHEKPNARVGGLLRGPAGAPRSRLRLGCGGHLLREGQVRMGREGIEPSTLGLRVPCSTS